MAQLSGTMVTTWCQVMTTHPTAHMPSPVPLTEKHQTPPPPVFELNNVTVLNVIIRHHNGSADQKAFSTFHYHSADRRAAPILTKNRSETGWKRYVMTENAHDLFSCVRNLPK